MRKRNNFALKSGRRPAKGRIKAIAVFAAAAVGIYFLVSLVFGEMGFVKYYRMNAQHVSLLKDTAALKKDNERLIGLVRALKTDPDYIERVARDKLGLARRGEIVYYYDVP
jgi:cell division protein FtsB